MGYLIDSSDEFYVMARHGKTKNMAVWRLTDVAESNSMLYSFSPPASNPGLEYKVPEGDLGGPNGLREKAILVDNVPFERIQIH